MNIARIVLLSLLALIAAAVAGYIVVAFGFFLAWELMGIRDRDGGGAMAVGFVFAPIGAAIFGIVGALATAGFLARRRAAPPEGKAINDANENRLLVRILGGLAGFVVGWQAAGWLRIILSRYTHEYLIAAIAFASAYIVLPFAFALLGYLLVRRRQGKAA